MVSLQCSYTTEKPLTVTLLNFHELCIYVCVWGAPLSNLLPLTLNSSLLTPWPLLALCFVRFLFGEWELLVRFQLLSVQ